MGKNLHYSIRPFVENALNNHNAVESLEKIELDDFYAYKITRRRGLSSFIVVLSDDYYFNSESLQKKPAILKDGGFFLKARPEGYGIARSIPEEKLGLGKLGKLLGAIHKEEYWAYEPPVY
ncbi:hypothetical protein [uncultured Dokdonia sp.]|uniref:hypothetical protein n=1 Tax=uncultured Dokdonia sp. TaxID=575653 RepID=UPI0030EBABD5|tara:strand:- start:10392 stop:10754 length:363 start_codon:yes stop_codon:yes gene_type:complete